MVVSSQPTSTTRAVCLPRENAVSRGPGMKATCGTCELQHQLTAVAPHNNMNLTEKWLKRALAKLFLKFDGQSSGSTTTTR